MTLSQAFIYLHSRWRVHQEFDSKSWACGSSGFVQWWQGKRLQNSELFTLHLQFKWDCMQVFECVFTILLFTLAQASHHSHYFFLPVIYFAFFPQNEITSGKVLFPEHLPLSRIQAGIKSGSFLQGTFRASRDNYLEASVFVHGEGEDSMEVCAFVCEHVRV